MTYTLRRNHYASRKSSEKFFSDKLREEVVGGASHRTVVLSAKVPGR